MPGKARCATHQAEADLKRNAARAAAKQSAAAQAGVALYATRKWKRWAKRFLARHPMCMDCGDLGVTQPATDVDHIKPHRGDEKLFWDWNNLQGLCKPCHSRKTAREVFGHKAPGVGQE